MPYPDWTIPVGPEGLSDILRGPHRMVDEAALAVRGDGSNDLTPRTAFTARTEWSLALTGICFPISPIVRHIVREVIGSVQRQLLLFTIGVPRLTPIRCRTHSGRL